MSTSTPSRRPYRERGSVKEKVNLFGKVEAPLKAKLDRIADAVGISQGAALELVLDHLELDADGRPVWYVDPPQVEHPTLFPKEGSTQLQHAS